MNQQVDWGQVSSVDAKFRSQPGNGRWNGNGKNIGLRKPSRRRLSDLDDDKKKKKAEEFDFKKSGVMGQEEIEALVIACFLRGANDSRLEEKMGIDREREAAKVFGSEVRGEYFRDELLGAMFESLRDTYVANGRKLVGIDEKGLDEQGSGQDANSVENYKDHLHECYAMMLARQIRARALVEQMSTRYRARRAELIYEKFLRDQKDSQVGPKEALARFRSSISQELAPRDGAAIQDSDFMEDFSSTVDTLVDMKYNPEKYAGLNCGIGVIDEKTKGFRPGHLTVFVGGHGGYKSTMMMNVAYGLWMGGSNVLYVSLEMETQLIRTKLICRGTQRVSFSRVYGGNITEESDWDEMERLQAELEDESLDKEERQAKAWRMSRLQNALIGLEKDGKGAVEDMALIKKFREENEAKPNKLKIINVGQSNKIRMSQIEEWLKEREGQFEPDVVIVDYLELVAPEKSYSDRRDQEVGDICKYMRQMGKQREFAVVTAAQFKRGASDRIRKHGAGKIDKIQFGTDDIAGSNQIGADADEVFVLLREDGGNKVRVLTIKARHGIPDTERGEVLQVVPDTCTIAGDDYIEDTSIRTGKVTIKEGIQALGAIREDYHNDPDDPENRLPAKIGDFFDLGMDDDLLGPAGQDDEDGDGEEDF